MAKRIAPSVYKMEVGDRTFTIDGQNGIEYNTGEWEVHEIFQTPYGEKREWIETFHTKRDAVAFIETI